MVLGGGHTHPYTQHLSLLCTLYVYIEVMMYTFILHINSWTPTYMYQLHLLLYSFNVVYITSHLSISIHCGIQFYLLTRLWVYCTTLWQGCCKVVDSKQPCHKLVTTLFNVDNLIATLIFLYGTSYWVESRAQGLIKSVQPFLRTSQSMRFGTRLHDKDQLDLYVNYFLI